MKKALLLLLITTGFFFTSCKEKESDNFKFLTGTTWVAESLLANGVDATGAGGLLANFVGDVVFNEDGTGSFGTYTGTWRFSNNETELVITSPDIPLPITADIVELTSTSLKLQTLFINPQNPTGPAIEIQMNFRPK